MHRPTPTEPHFYNAQTLKEQPCLGELMKKVLTLVNAQADAQLSNLGLTYAQWFPLKHLSLHGACTALQLAKQLGIDAGALSRSLDRLQIKGLIERKRSMSDRRVIQIALTQDGHAVVQQVPDMLAQVLNPCLQGVNDQRRAHFFETLTLIANNAMRLKSEGPLTPCA